MQFIHREVFIHGKKTWRPSDINLLPAPCIRVITNNRGKVACKQKYELSINDIQMPGEYKVTRPKPTAHIKTNLKMKHSQNTSSIEIRQINHSCTYKAEKILQVVEKKNFLARSVSLQWSKYSTSSRASSDTGFSENTFLSDIQPTTSSRLKYLSTKYMTLWRNFAARKPSRKMQLTEKVQSESLNIKPKLQTHKVDKLKFERQEEKIREQARLIKELQLARIKLEEELFTRETREMLKGKQKYSKAKFEPNSAHEQISIPNVAKYNPAKKFKDNWELVTKMELRAKERKERWDHIRQRKFLLEAEKEERLKLAEENRREREEAEKKRKLMEVREEKKRAIQLKKEIKEERFHLSKLNASAIEHHNKILLKSAFNSFLVFVKQRRSLLLEAEYHYNDKLLMRTYINWKLFWKIQVEQKMYAAENCHNKSMLTRSMDAFKNIHSEYIEKKRRSDQFRQHQLLKSYLYKWQMYTFEKKCELQRKEEAAVQHYELSIIRRYFENWTQLPLILFQEREKEQKIRSWCSKVKELLPDFQPSYELY